MSSLSSTVQAVVAIYSGPLQGISFADIDGDSLGSLASEVESISAEVEALEAQLVSLRDALAQKEEALLGFAQQALAYARIYAESDEALSAELNEIALPRASKPRKGTSNKAPSERGVRTQKEASTGGAELAEAEEVELAEAEPVELAKPKRKGSAAAAEHKAEVAAPAKTGRRKLPGRRA